MQWAYLELWIVTAFEELHEPGNHASLDNFLDGWASLWTHRHGQWNMVQAPMSGLRSNLPWLFVRIKQSQWWSGTE